MALWESIVLGIIQGIAEFLPISSSAHLIIFRDIFGIGASMSETAGLTFDIALHFGTLLAILLFFFHDFWGMLTKGLTKGIKEKEGRLLWYLVAATVPAAIMGVLFEDTIEKVIRTNYILIALALAIMGVIIYLADRFSKQEKDLGQLSLKDAILIGCSQVFALIPGFSRSGTTIAAGRALKLNREDAARFSFFLSAPVTAGAVVLQLLKKGTFALIEENLAIFFVGFFTSFLIGLLCIKFLLQYLKKHDFNLFMWYRIALCIIVITMVLIK